MDFCCKGDDTRLVSTSLTADSSKLTRPSRSNVPPIDDVFESWDGLVYTPRLAMRTVSKRVRPPVGDMGRF
jgi:hypothetical protein